MAYNHGKNGIRRVKEKLRTSDFRRIIREYHSSNFRFASRNFLLEVIAALEVDTHAERYFPGVRRRESMRSVEVSIADYVDFRMLVNHLGLSASIFQEMNPGLAEAVYSGKKRVPPGVLIRIPSDWGVEEGGPRQAFWKRYLEIPRDGRFREQAQVRSVK